MAPGLVVVHLHSWFLSQVMGVTLPFSSPSSTSLVSPATINCVQEHSDIKLIPLNEYIWWKAFNLSTDQIVTITLAVSPLLKYTFYDKPVQNLSHTSKHPSPSLQESIKTTYPPRMSSSKDITSAYFLKRSITLDTIPEVRSSEDLLARKPPVGGDDVTDGDTTLIPGVRKTREVSSQTDHVVEESVTKFAIGNPSQSDSTTASSSDDEAGTPDVFVEEDAPPRPV